MVKIDYIKNLISVLGFKKSSKKSNEYVKKYSDFDLSISVDMDHKVIRYPEDKGLRVNDKTTCNFENPENFVVLECVCRLLDKGYRPEHIELEKRWNLGHDSKGGKADICVYDSNNTDMLFIVECKTDGREHAKELKRLINDGGQLFSYWQQERSTKWLVLYSSILSGDKIAHRADSINCIDDANIVELSKKDNSIKTYKEAHTVESLYLAWSETYVKALFGDVVFDEDTVAYNIGIKHLRKKDLIDFSESDKIVNSFEEILRHNSISDKENAFNRLLALFICKLVDEISKVDDDIVDFQYKQGTDSYESLQDRLQRLHQQGMKEFMKEDIFYIPDDYAEKLIQQYTGQKRKKMIDELRKTLRIMKFYTNNDFAFKDVHNEQLFYQNSKALVEIVQLFEKYRIINSNKLQLLGDLFEQLLNKGFKQNEGQFFTPVPVAKFILNSLPLQSIMKDNDSMNYPKVIDYSCGAGHFLTESVNAINASASVLGEGRTDNSWVDRKIYGVEKDYRLARVAKVSLFMHGAGSGNIIFGDGLENYPDKDIVPDSFDILVANPPYSISSFKPHLDLKNNELSLINLISNDGSEIETLFVERIKQLLKANGKAAVILPDSILRKDNKSFIGAREILIQNFNLRAIVHLQTKTFGATGHPTAIFFLEKFDEPPKRSDLVLDTVEAIFASEELKDWEDDVIFMSYLDRIDVSIDDYKLLLNKCAELDYLKGHQYFSMYLSRFDASLAIKHKTSSKTYKKKSKVKKRQWYLDEFYKFVHDIEKEKLLYFSFIYKQEVLIINAPKEVKEQERFLGYKWWNRKGMEGIDVTNPGGLLYDASNWLSSNTLSALIRYSYHEQKYEIENLKEFYYYKKYMDMLDFDYPVFNKSINTSRPRIRKTRDDYTKYQISSPLFTIRIGKRVTDSDLTPEGISVYSANVFKPMGRIDKNLITDFSKDSVIWGIDGDWMVNQIEAGTEFYPTDHCGVIHINDNSLRPDYLKIALSVEGRQEGFSRNNRASVQRIKRLSLYVPNLLDEQQRIVNEIESEKDIKKREQLIQRYFVE